MGRNWDIFSANWTKRRSKRLFIFSCKISVAILEHGWEGREQEWKQAWFGGFCDPLEGKYWWDGQGCGQWTPSKTDTVWVQNGDVQMNRLKNQSDA